MIVDTSAIVAVLRAEPGWERFDEALRADPDPQMSAATYTELGVVVDRLEDPVISRRLDSLLTAWGITIVAFNADQARIARRAYADFGRGSGHRAGLNLGDCFTYALTAECGEPLLFKGEDFTHTDIQSALK